MYLYLFTSTAWKFICTVCSTEFMMLQSKLQLNLVNLKLQLEVYFDLSVVQIKGR